MPFVEWCARRGIDPNAITVVSLVITTGAAVAFYLSSPVQPWLLLVGAALLGIGATLDSADGLLARTTDQATALGDYLDHAFDRFADALLLLGFSFSAWIPVELGLLAVVGTLLTSYMGTQAQAVGVGRDYGGIAGRADRLMLLTWVPILQFGMDALGYSLPTELAGIPLPADLSLIWLAFAWIAFAGNITALQRFWGAYNALAEDGKP